MIPSASREWVFDAAQTDFKLVDFDSTHRGVVTYGQITIANSATVDVSVRVGFATATLPTITNNAAGGSAGVFMSHGGIAKGGGMVVANGGAPIDTGDADEDLRITCSAPTGGTLRLVLSYWIDTLS